MRNAAGTIRDFRKTCLEGLHHPGADYVGIEPPAVVRYRRSEAVRRLPFGPGRRDVSLAPGRWTVTLESGSGSRISRDVHAGTKRGPALTNGTHWEPGAAR